MFDVPPDLDTAESDLAPNLALPALPTPTVESSPAPVPQAPPAPSRRVGTGMTVVVAGAATIGGALWGGGWGAGSGLLGAGAMSNAVRAARLWGDPAQNGEAVKSAAIAAIGFFAAGFCGYKAYQARAER